MLVMIMPMLALLKHQDSHLHHHDNDHDDRHNDDDHNDCHIDDNHNDCHHDNDLDDCHHDYTVIMILTPQDSQDTQLTCRAGNTNLTAQVIKTQT